MGFVLLPFTSGSGILVSGTGIVIFSVGIMVLLVVGAVVEGSVTGSIMEQLQAHKFSARIRPNAVNAIFFTKNPPFYKIATVVFHP
jgi:hypothetical protein